VRNYSETVFMLRPGHTYRIYDSVAMVQGRKHRAIVCFDPASDAACYRPQVTILCNYTSRDKLDCAKRPYIATKRISFVIPHMTFARAYKLRRFGALRYYKAESRMYYRLFSTRKRTA
jgi:hypothetical protein